MIAGKASTRQQSVQRQTGRAHLVKQTQTRQQGAMPRPTASVMQALQGRMEDRARSVRRESTKQQQEPTLAVIAGKASTRQQLVQRQTQRAHLVQRIRTRLQGAMPRPTASVMQALQGRMEDRARSVLQESTK